MEIVLGLGLILVMGYFFGLFASTMNLPKISFYLLAGILFSESMLGQFIELHINEWSNIFSSIALSFIAYIVGSEINLARLEKNKKVILYGVFAETALAVALVYIAFELLGLLIPIPKHLSLALAAIAATTAPASTLGVIEEYRAKGEMTSSLLGIVALDDALGIFIFSLFSILFFSGGEGGLLLFFEEIGLALVVGGLFGYFLKKVSLFSKSSDYLFPLLVGSILIVFYLSETYRFSGLFACIVLGMTANNIRTERPQLSLLLPIQHIEDLIFISFFTFAGAHFSPESFAKGFVLIVVYIIARASGKYIGAYLGTRGGGASKRTSKWIGLALFPQAGVAIGLVLQTEVFALDSGLKEVIINVILGSTIIYEVIGPFFAKLAFDKAGEITHGQKDQ